MVENFTTFYEGDITTTYTSTTLPAGYKVGMERRESSKTYTLFLAAGTIASAALFKPNTATALPFSVIATAAAVDAVVGVNTTGASVASGTYFWGQVGGVASVSSDGTAAISAGQPLAASASAGVAALAPTSTALRTQFGTALEALATGTGNILVRLQGLRT